MVLVQGGWHSCRWTPPFYYYFLCLWHCLSRSCSVPKNLSYRGRFGMSISWILPEIWGHRMILCSSLIPDSPHRSLSSCGVIAHILFWRYTHPSSFSPSATLVTLIHIAMISLIFSGLWLRLGSAPPIIDWVLFSSWFDYWYIWDCPGSCGRTDRRMKCLQMRLMEWTSGFSVLSWYLNNEISTCVT